MACSDRREPHACDCAETTIHHPRGNRGVRDGSQGVAGRSHHPWPARTQFLTSQVVISRNPIVQKPPRLTPLTCTFDRAETPPPYGGTLAGRRGPARDATTRSSIVVRATAPTATPVVCG